MTQTMPFPGKDVSQKRAENKTCCGGLSESGPVDTCLCILTPKLVNHLGKIRMHSLVTDGVSLEVNYPTLYLWIRI